MKPYSVILYPHPRYYQDPFYLCLLYHSESDWEWLKVSGAQRSTEKLLTNNRKNLESDLHTSFHFVWHSIGSLSH